MKALPLTLLAALLATSAHAADYRYTKMLPGLQGPAPSAPPAEEPQAEPLAITLNAAFLPEATVGQPYAFDFYPLASISGDGAPVTPEYVWNSADPLPAGLTLSANGILSGTPMTQGTADFEVVAGYLDAEGRQVYTIIVGEAVLQVTMISAGDMHSCALTTGGGVKCWGYGNSGRLGDGSTTARLTPVDVSGLTSGVTAIAAGGSHTCALTTDDGVKCWGSGAQGRLGDGSTTTRLTPVNVSGLTSGVTAIAAGGSHTCAVTTGGGVKCWGSGDSGRLGYGGTANQFTPVDVSDLTSGVTAIAAGGSHTCAVTTGGGVKCWGHGLSGQLGTGNITSQLTPVDVSELTSGVATISASGGHTCAVTTDGGAKCWGGNGLGQLGTGNTTSQLTPVDVSELTSGVAAISVGAYHTCAVTTDGGVKCWGYGNSGRLGDGSTTTRLTPVDVSGLTSGVTAIAAGGSHTCALTTDDGVKCWGDGTFGRLGNGATANQATPVEVSP